MLLQLETPLLEQMFPLSEEQPQLFATDDPLSLEPAVYVAAHLPAACTALGRATTSTASTIPIAILKVFIGNPCSRVAEPLQVCPSSADSLSFEFLESTTFLLVIRFS